MIGNFIIGYDFSNGLNKEILIVGKQTARNKPVEIVNAFQGKEAREIYEKLTSKKEKKDE